jgi:hypothetical protein
VDCHLTISNISLGFEIFHQRPAGIHLTKAPVAMLNSSRYFPFYEIQDQLQRVWNEGNIHAFKAKQPVHKCNSRSFIP